MITSPLLRYLDFMTILNRHYFAPRAKTEEEMFACFKGGWYNLAERFTDFTKVLLLCTFYSTFYPLIYFFGAGVILAQYWMDKFLLLVRLQCSPFSFLSCTLLRALSMSCFHNDAQRSWQRCPYFGPEAAKFSRTYFNTAAILLGAISSVSCARPHISNAAITIAGQLIDLCAIRDTLLQVRRLHIFVAVATITKNATCRALNTTMSSYWIQP